MKLNVLSSQTAGDPWYAQGLRFTCTQCGNCCTGPPGYVWISQEEIVRLGEFLGISAQQVVERYCRKISGRFSLKEFRNPRHGGFDCVFLKEMPGQQGAPGRRGCTIYPVRPLQCRTWPFWTGNLHSSAAWAETSRRCPGMNRGKSYDRASIESIRDSKDWPRHAPESDKPDLG